MNRSQWTSESGRHLRQALVTGSYTLAASSVVGAVILVVLDWLGALSTRDDWLPFAEMWSGVAAIFVAGVVGWWALQEFVAGQAQPKLRLAFHPQGREVIQLSPEYTAPTYSVALALYNDGDAVAVWYMLQLTAPFLGFMAQHVSPFDNHPFSISNTHTQFIQAVQPTVGSTDDNWRYAYWEGKEGRLITFMSEGRIAVYPRFPLHLCTINVEATWLRVNGSIEIDYTIASERSSPVSGKLRVDVQA
jgi:hypothetical protein